MAEVRTVDEIVNEYSRMCFGNPIRTIWSLVDAMKKNYEIGNNDDAEIFYEAVVSVIKEKMVSE